MTHTTLTETLIENKDHQFDLFINRLRSEFNIQKKIILLQCPTFNFEAFNLETAKNSGYYAYPPRGLQCIAATVKKLGFAYTIIDLNYLLLSKLSDIPTSSSIDLNYLINEILNENMPKDVDGALVGIATGVIVPNVFGSKKHPYIQTLSYFMSRNKHIVLTGGPVATVEKRNILRMGLAHAVFTGEAENKISYFAGTLLGVNGVRETPGIFYKLSNSTV